jgi:hypothetical protein
VWVDGRKAVFAPGEHFRFGAATFAQGNIVDALRHGTAPARSGVHDEFGFASGALEFGIQLGPGASHDLYLVIPFSRQSQVIDHLAGVLASPTATGGSAFGAAQHAHAMAQWRAKLDRIGVHLPGAAQQFAQALKTAVAHVLINRDGPALQPGPRRYTRSWIRDGATMAAALLRAGCREEACAFIEWYVTFQADDGNVPCCVDERGPDWLVEHDSHGELIFTVMECYRFTQDRALLLRLWPAVLKAVRYIEQLRASRLTAEYRTPELRARYGLLPESASHEGYLAHPVHAYWDDFWALRGLRDAVGIAAVLGETAQVERISGLRDGLRSTLYASLADTIATRQLDFVPGSVEWADFDPTATANVALLDELRDQPRPALDRTFERYLEMFRKRLASEDWGNYTPYEIRNVTALIALGRRSDAHEVAAFLLADRRPLSWNQWPEIAWRLPYTPGHIGDVPHSWIGAEYVIAVRSMLVYEVEHEHALVIGAGLPAAWLESGPVSASELPTYYGKLDLRLAQTAPGTLEVSLAGTLHERVQLRVVPPLPGRLSSAWLNGQALECGALGVTIGAADLPAKLTLHC